MSTRLKFVGDIEIVQAGINIFSRRFGFEVGEGGFVINVTRTSGPLHIALEGNKGEIAYGDTVQFFRALGLFIESSNEADRFSLLEEPQFSTIGACIDCSRNGVLRLESVKEIIEISAGMGINLIALYTEDTYVIESEPYFGYLRGRYSFDELRELDQYAELFGIEMMPCIQTLGHLEQFLKWEAAEDYRDSDSVLLVDCDPVYNLIEKMIRSASAPFRSKRIHIGMDEAFGLGRGRYLDINGWENRFEMMNRHLQKVLAITDRYGLSPIIWSDMYFTIGSKTGDYFDLDSVVPDDVAARIPKNVQLAYWDYYHHDEAFYSKMIQKHKSMGFQPIFTGGIWTWTGFSTNYGRTFVDSNAALNACKKEGVQEVIVTMWGDDGTENNYFTGLLGLQLFAEHGYTKVLNMDKLKRRVKFCTGVDFDAYMDIRYLDEVPGVPQNNPESCNPSKYLLWQDLLLGLFDKHIEEEKLDIHYDWLEKRMASYKIENPYLLAVFNVLEKLCSVLKVKACLGIKIAEYYRANEKAALRAIADKEIPLLRTKVDELRKAHREAWYMTYKPFGWEVLDLRYGGVMSRADSVVERLKSFVEGKIGRIEELEEEKLYFREKIHEIKFTNCEEYAKIVTPNAF